MAGKTPNSKLIVEKKKVKGKGADIDARSVLSLHSNSNRSDRSVLQIPGAIRRKSAVRSVYSMHSQKHSSYVFLPGQIHADPGRQKWPQEMDSILALVAFAVDIANISRFPLLCYSNGKSAFLIPYFTVLIFCAWPLLYMELILGQYIQQGCLSVWKIVPMFKGVGYCIEMILILVMCYYSTIMSWSFVYIIGCFNGTIPWSTCDHTWNTEDCIIPRTEDYNARRGSLQEKLAAPTTGSEFFRGRVLKIVRTNYTEEDISFFKVNDTNECANCSFGFHSKLGSPDFELCSWCCFIFCLYFIILVYGLDLSRKITWVTSTVPYVILAILLFRGLTLPSGIEGVTAFLLPDFGALIKPETWVAASIQVLYSTGAGFCVHLTHASHNKFNHDIYRDSIWVSAANSFTSIFSSLVMFCYLGAMTKVQGYDANNITQGLDALVEMHDGIDLIFEIYPDCVSRLSGSKFFLIIFFIMIVFIGFDTAVGAVQSITLGFLDPFKKWFPEDSNSEQIFNFACISLCFVFSLLCYTRGGMWVYLFMDKYSAGVSLVLAAFTQCVLVAWIWGMEDLCNAAEAMTGRRPGVFLRLCWKFITPTILILVAYMSLKDLRDTKWAKYNNFNSSELPEAVVVTGEFISFAPISCVLIYAIYQMVHFPAPSFKMRFLLLLCPENEHAQILETGTTVGNRLTFGHIFYFGGLKWECKKKENLEDLMTILAIREQERRDHDGQEHLHHSNEPAPVINIVSPDGNIHESTQHIPSTKAHGHAKVQLNKPGSPADLNAINKTPMQSNLRKSGSMSIIAPAASKTQMTVLKHPSRTSLAVPLPASKSLAPRASVPLPAPKSLAPRASVPLPAPKSLTPKASAATILKRKIGYE